PGELVGANEMRFRLARECQEVGRVSIPDLQILTAISQAFRCILPDRFEHRDPRTSVCAFPADKVFFGERLQVCMKPGDGVPANGVCGLYGQPTDSRSQTPE